MNGFEQSSMNMMAHNRVLLEVGGYTLLVGVDVVHRNRRKNKSHFQSILCYIFKFGNGSELESSHHYHFRSNIACVPFVIYQPSR